ALTSDLLELLMIQTLTEGQAELLQFLDPNSDMSDSKDEDVCVLQLSGVFLTLLADLHATRYLQDRIHIPRDGGQLWLTLGCYKNKHPALFQSLLHLAVVLYQFSHFGNAASMQKVSLWAGLGYGTVDKCMWWVMKAVCDESFRRVVMRWPNENEKEEASRWVESHSCLGWRGGWLMVDGTLVPLFAQLGFYGNSWYDHRSNYSLNVQVCVHAFSPSVF
ncbi:hypothetical protein K439DRAFT_1632704, partial [Ramaria rubella]